MVQLRRLSERQLKVLSTETLIAESRRRRRLEVMNREEAQRIDRELRYRRIQIFLKNPVKSEGGLL